MSAAAHCKRVGIRAKTLAGYYGVPADRVSYWHRENRKLFDHKLAEAAVAARGRR